MNKLTTWIDIQDKSNITTTKVTGEIVLYQSDKSKQPILISNNSKQWISFKSEQENTFK